MNVDLDGYFERIGYTGPHTASVETLHAITRAHAQSIPFENIDVLLGRRIELAQAALYAKLVVAQRGGYCFEQNGLLLEILKTHIAASCAWRYVGSSCFPTSTHDRRQPCHFTQRLICIPPTACWR
ncbi:MAG TPA: arylamine N-acetyltransferase, partial [Rhodanobacteraceae bacterium]